MQALAQRIETSLGPVRKRYEEIYQNLKNVPENPPRNFREAVQALWFLFDFQRLCGNWPGIGRIDKMLGGFLQRDLDSGAITLEEAREYLAHFWIKGAEWVNGTNEDIQPDSGDGQNYQNIILSGIDEDGKDVTNLVTYLVLDVVEELGISDFPISVRLSPETDPRLLRRVAEVLKLGGGILRCTTSRLCWRPSPSSAIPCGRPGTSPMTAAGSSRFPEKPASGTTGTTCCGFSSSRR